VSERLAGTGNVGFVQKPFDRQQLLEKVQAALK
jgi:FixJ family two-component response regulator